MSYLQIRIYRIRAGENACDVCNTMSERWWVDTKPQLPFHDNCKCEIEEVDPESVGCRRDFRNLTEHASCEVVIRSEWLRNCSSDDSETWEFEVDPKEEDDFADSDFLDYVDNNASEIPEHADQGYTVELAGRRFGSVRFGEHRVTVEYSAEELTVCDLPDGTTWTKYFGLVTGTRSRTVGMHEESSWDTSCYGDVEFSWDRVG